MGKGAFRSSGGVDKGGLAGFRRKDGIKSQGIGHVLPFGREHSYLRWRGFRDEIIQQCSKLGCLWEILVFASVGDVWEEKAVWE